jgi:hypothetical protein
MKKILVVSLFILTSALVFAAGRKEGRLEINSEVTISVEKTLQADPQDTILIRNTVGLIGVTGWDRGEIRVTGLIGEDIVDVELSRTTPDTIILDVLLPEEDNLADVAGAAELEISLPSTCAVDIWSIQAGVTVRGVGGETVIRTVAGPVNVSNDERSAPLSVSTVGGLIAVSGPYEMVRVESGVADISIDGVIGSLIAGTTSGSIVVKNSYLETAEVSAGMGDILIDCGLAPTGIIRASTSFGGSIELILPREIQGRITMSSGSGAIDRTSFKPATGVITVFQSNRSLPGLASATRITGRIGASGSVTITRRTESEHTGTSTGETKGSVWLKTREGDARPLALMGGKLTEIVVGSGDARIYLETLSPVSRSREEKDADQPSTIVLKTRS